MSGPAAIPPEPSFSAQPPNGQANQAARHQAITSAGMANALGKVIDHQKYGIEAGNYYIKIMKWLQEILGEFTTAIAEMQAGSWPGGVDALLQALKDLSHANGMSAKELGGAFGAKVGASIKKAVTAIYNAVKTDLGTMFAKTPFPQLSKALVLFLENPSKYPITYKDKQDIQYEIGQMQQQGRFPLKGLLNTIDEQTSAIDSMTALMIAQITHLKNNGISALQTIGKVMNQMWKVLIQMISTMQSGN